MGKTLKESQTGRTRLKKKNREGFKKKEVTFGRTNGKVGVGGSSQHGKKIRFTGMVFFEIAKRLPSRAGKTVLGVYRTL